MVGHVSEHLSSINSQDVRGHLSFDKALTFLITLASQDLSFNRRLPRQQPLWPTSFFRSPLPPSRGHVPEVRVSRQVSIPLTPGPWEEARPCFFHFDSAREKGLVFSRVAFKA